MTMPTDEVSGAGSKVVVRKAQARLSDRTGRD